MKCKERQDEKNCKNIEKAQNELALEAWNKVKPGIKERLDKVSKAMEAGDYGGYERSSREIFKISG